MTQDSALQILKTGANVFLTGEPGSGKTHTVNAYVRYLREHNITPSITASTGIAATHVGGMTIHSWSGIGIAHGLSERDIELMREREPLVKRLRAAKVLVIDEVSMLPGAVLDMVDRVLRELRGSTESFGGLQVVFVGDFFQLPPVSKEGDPKPSFAFASAAWAEAKPVVCYLSEQHRQEDATFLMTLAAIRRGEIEEEVYTVLAARHTREGEHPEDVPHLHTHNIDVDRKNDAALARIGAEERVFRMSAKGREARVETLKKGCLSPEVLTLKKGAAVMFTKNNFEGGYVNGTLGEVIGFETDAEGGYPIVRTREGRRIVATPAEWAVEDNGKVLASITQIPLRLAWAITVHKSQGMSMDAAVMNLADAFEYGQGYVALSRVRTLAGVHLLGINRRALEVHPIVLARDASFRMESDAAEEGFTALGEEELAIMQRNFILAKGGTVEKKTAVPKIPKAKKLPTREETKRILLQKLSLADTAKARGFTEGTIIAHAEELRMRGEDIDLDLAHWIPDFGREKFDRIMTAFAKFAGTPDEGRLTPVRAALGEDVSFDETRFAKLISGKYLPERKKEGAVPPPLLSQERDGVRSSSLSLDPDKAAKRAASLAKFPNMGAKWTAEEEDRLRAAFAEGKKISQIAQEFGRKFGGIRARLIKLGLIDE